MGVQTIQAAIASLTKEGIKTFGKALVYGVGKTVLKLLKEPVEEMLEEVIVDEFIEAGVESLGAEWGWSEEAIYWASSLGTSIREALFGPVLKNVMQGLGVKLGLTSSDPIASYNEWYSTQKARYDLSDE
jgi:hypothetical protein